MPSVELPGLYIHSVAAQIATSRPILINRDPGPGELGVPLGSCIALDIVDPGPDGIDRAETRIFVDGVLAFEGLGSPEFKPGFDGPRATAAQTQDTLRIVLDRAMTFVSQAQVSVRVVTATAGGHSDFDETYTFVAEDRTPPKVISAQAIAPNLVRIGFDEEVLVTAPTGFDFTPIDLPAVPVQAAFAASEGTSVHITTDTAFTAVARYRVTVRGVADVRANPVGPPDDVAVFKGFCPPQPVGRRFDLGSMLPRHNLCDDVTEDLRRFLACLQEVLGRLLAQIDRFCDLFTIERAPEDFLDLILRDLGNPFPFVLSTVEKRKLASVLVAMYRQKGTAIGIKNAIRFFLGIELTAITPYTHTTLILGVSELGIDWELGPSDRFARYAFNVEVSKPLSAPERDKIRAIVEYMKPAHTHFVDLIEPEEPVFVDHWELGISALGVTTDLHG